MIPEKQGVLAQSGFPDYNKFSFYEGFLCGLHTSEVCFCANHFLPIVAHFEMPILAKLAETALPFYRVADVSFLPKMNQNWYWRKKMLH